MLRFDRKQYSVKQLSFNELIKKDKKNPSTMQEMGRRQVFDPWVRGSPREGHGNLLQYIAGKIPYIEEPGRLWSMGSQRVKHD